MTSRLRSLSEIAPGTRVILVALAGGHHLRSRLASVGFTSGAELVLLRNTGHGPVLVEVRGTLMALGRGEAAHVIVSDGEAP